MPFSGTIKAVGDRAIKIPTQCVLAKNAADCHPATIANILLKINDKLSGTNFSSNFNRELPSFRQVSVLSYHFSQLGIPPKKIFLTALCWWLIYFYK